MRHFFSCCNIVEKGLIHSHSEIIVIANYCAFRDGFRSDDSAENSKISIESESRLRGIVTDQNIVVINRTCIGIR